MKLISVIWLLMGFSLLFTAVVHAQAACPPGTIPYGTGQDQSVCGPDNSQQQPTQQQLQPPPHPLPPVWVDRWGAITTDAAHHSSGASLNQSSKVVAEQEAIADCQKNGGVQCKIEITYHNQCVALVGGDTGYNTTSASSIGQAVQIGMASCTSAHDTNCHAYYTACSLPVRVQ